MRNTTNLTEAQKVSRIQKAGLAVVILVILPLIYILVKNIFALGSALN